MQKTSLKSPEAQPKYLHFYEDIRRQIQNGQLTPGDRLPSFSKLRTLYGAMPSTAERVYARLERENLVVREARRGVFVASRQLARTGNIGLLWRADYPSSTHSSTHMEALFSGIREICREHDMETLLIDNGQTMRRDKIDGVLLCCDTLEAYALGIPPEMPHVLLFRRADGITTIAPDDFGGGELATAHLIEKGHRRIACLMEELLDAPLQRAAGYRTALQKAHIESDPRWLRQVKKTNFQPSLTSTKSPYLEWARHHMRAWIAEDWKKLDCSAIVVQNDQAAIGVMQVLQEAGIEVPGQVSIIGFDGTSVCDLVSPRLASIEVPFYQIGQEAVKVLCEQIEHGTQAPRNITFPVKLREGDSVAPFV